MRKPLGDHTTVEVRALPTCDFHAGQNPPKMVPAHYDGATTLGPWANMCDDCFAQYGIGLGLGRGQRLKPMSKLDKLNAVVRASEDESGSTVRHNAYHQRVYNDAEELPGDHWADTCRPERKDTDVPSTQ